METFIESELIEQKALQRVISNPEYTVIFLTTAAESGNRMSEMEILLSPGGGNELHKHLNFAETFIPLEGALGVQVGPNKLLLKPGEQYTVPIGMPHNFSNPGSQPIRFRVVIEPGHEGFERSLRMLYGLQNEGLADVKTWDGLLRASVVLVISDMRLAGKKAILNPLMPILYRIACRKGYDREMIRKYCI
ncbi:cupin domain-containing protein [Dyadobacter sp. CY261]|uniref:cupin domain-containing protein n=1 Tax=Dyadobacter sp. CY261 TaxID=2907203 RepID=UPI001F33745F|nr:cupin domain-containing protein [Dyadobacter sp. CY261]MCF0074307.1 cupin domain-containing protein [Dyadobacter sp. CY261]